jgi:hypothetical protein
MYCRNCLGTLAAFHCVSFLPLMLQGGAGPKAVTQRRPTADAPNVARDLDAGRRVFIGDLPECTTGAAACHHARVLTEVKWNQKHKCISCDWTRRIARGVPAVHRKHKERRDRPDGIGTIGRQMNAPGIHQSVCAGDQRER